MLQTPYPFTPKGEAALRQAEHLARRLHHKYIGTEHLPVSYTHLDVYKRQVIS